MQEKLPTDMGGENMSDKVQQELGVIYYEESNEILKNPGMGWVMLEEPLYEGRASLGWLGDFPEVSNISLSTSWAYMEPEDGKYDWSVMDKAVEYWTSRGKKINMRVSMDTNCIGYPRIGAPKWLGDKDHVPYKYIMMDGERVRSYYLADPVFLKKHDEFVKAFAEHFKDNPDINVIEIRSYGAFGEWHSGGLFQSMEERIRTLKHMLEVWKEAWGDKKLMVVSASYEFDRSAVQYDAIDTYMTSMEQFTKASAFDYALNLGITFRRDGIGGALHYWDAKFLYQVFKLNNDLPLLGEPFSGYDFYLKNQGGYNLYDLLSEALYKVHINYMTTLGWVAGAFSPVESNESRWVDFGSRSMGYRLVPHKITYDRKAAPGGVLKLDQLWSNTAVGRAWNEFDLKVYLKGKDGKEIWSGTDESFDPSIFINGDIHLHESSFTLPDHIAAGDYDLYFAVTDSVTGKAAVKLPISGNDGSMKYYIGDITVKDIAEDKAAEDEASDEGTAGNKTAVGETVEDKTAYNDTANDGIGEDKQADNLAAKNEIVSRSEYSHLLNENFDGETSSYFSLSINAQLINDTSGNGKMIYSGIKGKRFTGETLVSTKDLKLKPETVYLVHFKYRSDIRQEDITVSDKEGYCFHARSRSSGKVYTSYSWQDVSAKASERTILFYTGEDEDCELAWSLDNAYPFMIDDISIYELGDGIYSSFEENDKSIFREENGLTADAGTLAIQPEGAVNGDYGMVINTNAGDGQTGVARTAFSLKPNTSYIVSFSTKGLKQELMSEVKGDYFYLALKSDTNPDFSQTISNWYEWSDYGPVNKTFCFITGGLSEYHLEFGANRNTKYSVDDFILAEEKQGSLVKAENNFKVERNISRAPAAKNFPVTEDFEKGVYDAGYFGAGSGYKGRLVTDGDKVIEGKYSAFGKVYDENYDEWVEYLNSTPEKLPLKKGKTYHISFKFRVIDTPGGKGRSYFSVQNSAGDNIAEVSLYGKSGEINTYKTTVTPEDNGYTLHWYLHWNGSIVIDCVKITEQKS